ncbi:uncharacterized protein LOC122315551 [Carya illinoinensis]|uniref:uncharacterized protein LOC122315551 n=1 Tax=Carya illinoinensis TaxID=32201 RepID=UPI001C718FF9|nr:uncharacterized protein LOC122315551 [Carya illinoinensis]
MNVEIMNCSNGHINAWVTNEEGSERWMLTGFYGQPNSSLRVESWQLLASMKPSERVGWCVMGDFNEVLTHDEKSRGKQSQEKQMVRFREALEDGGLFDLGWRDDNYTWSNNHGDDTLTKERLDRAVANLRWKEMFKEAWVEVLVARCSDHRSLLLSMNQEPAKVWRGKRLFRYEAKWSLMDDCEEVIKRAWQVRATKRASGRGLQSLLENSKGALMQWSKRIEHDRRRDLKEKTELLKKLQGNEGWHNSEEIKKVQNEIGVCLEMEDLKWSQRAKVD